MARILLIGGHGKIALQTTPLLARDGHAVDAVIRNPDHADEVAETGAIPIVADVESMSTAELADLSAEHDAVIWAAGAGGGDPERTWAVDRDAAIRSIDAAAQAGVRRYLMISYYGAGPDHGVPEDDGFFAYAESKAAADAHLRDSSLDWVVLGPSRLTDEAGTGRITRDEGKGEVSRANVAEVLAHVAADPSISGVTVEFNDGDQPIAEVLSSL
jgi:nucleoside-diphosphate-sugar epimerase